MTTDPKAATQERIAVVTDSTADLDPSVAGSFGIHVLPLHVIYREGSYRDGVDITPDEVYSRLAREIPSTSTPSPQEAVDLLTGIRDRGFTHVLALHISGAISGTIETVRFAAKEVAGLTTSVLDTKVISMGMGFVAMEAARLVREGKTSFAGLVDRVKGIVPQSNIFCTLKTLDYFRKGGRIGAVAAAAAGILNIKPLISMKDGVFYSPGRVRGWRQSLDAIADLARQAVEAGANRIAVMHGDALEDAQTLLQKVKALPGTVAPIIGRIGTTLGVHGGPGTVGVCVAKV